MVESNQTKQVKKRPPVQLHSIPLSRSIDWEISVTAISAMQDDLWRHMTNTRSGESQRFVHCVLWPFAEVDPTCHWLHRSPGFSLPPPHSLSIYPSLLPTTLLHSKRKLVLDLTMNYSHTRTQERPPPLPPPPPRSPPLPSPQRLLLSLSLSCVRTVTLH